MAQKPKKGGRKNTGKVTHQSFKSTENQILYKQVTGLKYPSREKVIKIAIQFHENRLKTEKLYLYTRSNYRQEINTNFQYDLKTFCERFSERSGLQFFRGDHPLRGERVLRGIVRGMNPKIDYSATYITPGGFSRTIGEKVNDKLNWIWRSVHDVEIKEYFTLDKILELVEENKNYPFLHQQREAQVAILKEIPDAMPDLFPGARSLKRHFILHIGPTNSGKTYEAVQRCIGAERGIYLAPLRLLAMEVAEKINGQGVPCNMITGEEEQILENAQHVASTVEMMDFGWHDVGVIDECQMVADPHRGWAWTQAILGMVAKEIHLCMAPEAQNVAIALIEECGDSYEIKYHKRATPLKMDKSAFQFPKDVRDGDALVLFSRRMVLQVASALEDEGKNVSVIYGALPYGARRAETHKFATGETKVVVTTDAIGMGMNLPVKRVVFLETQKFDGIKKRDLHPDEIKQVAGRAGRRGYEELGLVNAGFDKHKIAKGLRMEVDDLKRARTTMPPFLINMDRALSQIMKDWQSIKDHPPYLKSDLTRNIELCEWMERRCPLPKEEILRGISIPFDEENTILLSMWKKAMTNRLEELPILTGFSVVMPDEGDNLETLEGKYKILDLIYALIRSFGAGESYLKEQKEHILYCKEEMSLAIISLLKKNKKTYKLCKNCGDRLPWNYPFGFCSVCHEARMEQW